MMTALYVICHISHVQPAFEKMVTKATWVIETHCPPGHHVALLAQTWGESTNVVIPGHGSRVQAAFWTVPLDTAQAAPPLLATCVTIYCLVWTPDPHVTVHGPNDVQAPMQSTGAATKANIFHYERRLINDKHGEVVLRQTDDAS
jgi:hypothetical protein